MLNFAKPAPLCGTFAERGTFLSVEPLFGTLGNLNLCVEPWGTWTFMWNLEPFKSGCFMCNLGEPCARFPAAAPNHPEAFLEELAFQAVGENMPM